MSAVLGPETTVRAHRTLPSVGRTSLYHSTSKAAHETAACSCTMSNIEVTRACRFQHPQLPHFPHFYLPPPLPAPAEIFMYGMLCSMAAAGIWVTMATYLELAVSTTHSISKSKKTVMHLFVSAAPGRLWPKLTGTTLFRNTRKAILSWWGDPSAHHPPMPLHIPSANFHCLLPVYAHTAISKLCAGAQPGPYPLHLKNRVSDTPHTRSCICRLPRSRRRARLRTCVGWFELHCVERSHTEFLSLLQGLGASDHLLVHLTFHRGRIGSLQFLDEQVRVEERKVWSYAQVGVKSGGGKQ